jgi:hypothetical protein
LRAARAVALSPQAGATFKRGARCKFALLTAAGVQFFLLLAASLVKGLFLFLKLAERRNRDCLAVLMARIIVDALTLRLCDAYLMGEWDLERLVHAAVFQNRPRSVN